MSASEESSGSVAEVAMPTVVNARTGQVGTAIINRAFIPPSLLQTWKPTHGIVFNSSSALLHQRLASTDSRSEDGTAQAYSQIHKAIDGNNAISELPNKEKQALEDSTIAELSKISTDLNEALRKHEVEPEEVSESAGHSNSRKDKVPETSFTYKMTEDLFRESRNAPSESALSYWSHNLYRGSPGDDGVAPKVKVHYCQSLHTSERVVSQYFLSQKVVGFDIEWAMDATRHSGPKQNVSLIQLASEERIALIHIALFAKDHTSALVAPSFKKLMEDPNITKVGVAIKGDSTRLRNNLDIKSRGLFELSHLFKLIKYCESKDYRLINKKLVSLKDQVQEHLHLPMFKGVDVRTSDWSKRINMEQINYAAGDSYAGLQLYDVMNLKRQNLDPIPPLPYHAELNKPIRIAEGVALTIDTAAEEQDDPDDAVLIRNTPASKRSSVSTLKNSKFARSEVVLESDSDPSDPDFSPSQDLESISSPSPSTRKTSKPKSAPSRTPLPNHPLLDIAISHVETHRAHVSTITRTSTNTNTAHATPAHLRAYFLWSLNPSLAISEIASIIRTPPLQVATVTTYILEAIRLDGKDLDGGKWGRERVKELLDQLGELYKGRTYILKRYDGLRRDVDRVLAERKKEGAKVADGVQSDESDEKRSMESGER